MGMAEKMLRVMNAVSKLTYDSTNLEVGYKYVSAAKVNAAVNRALVENGIFVVADTEIHDIHPVGIEHFATVKVTLVLCDTDSDDDVRISGVGSGIDAGDKAVAKAQTMAVKYALKNTFLIADASDDPDANANTRAYSNIEAPF